MTFTIDPFRNLINKIAAYPKYLLKLPFDWRIFSYTLPSRGEDLILDFLNRLHLPRELRAERTQSSIVALIRFKGR